MFIKKICSVHPNKQCEERKAHSWPISRLPPGRRHTGWIMGSRHLVFVILCLASSAIGESREEHHKIEQTEYQDSPLTPTSSPLMERSGTGSTRFRRGTRRALRGNLECCCCEYLVGFPFYFICNKLATLEPDQPCVKKTKTATLSGRWRGMDLRWRER